MASIDTRASGATYDLDPGEGKGFSLFSALRRRVLVIIVTTLFVGAAAAGIAYAGRNNYESTAQLLFEQTIGAQLNALGLLPPAPNVDKLVLDNAALVSSRDVASLAASQLGVTTDDLQKNVTVSGSKNNDVVSIVAKASSPQRAAQLANVYAHAAIQLARTAQTGQTKRLLASYIAATRSSGPPTGLVLLHLQELRALAKAGTGNPRLIQTGFVPTHKSGNVLQATLLGVLFGAVLGVGLALLREVADRRLHRAEDVSAAFEAPVLTTVPRDRALKRHVAYGDLPPRVAEAFRMLQMNLRYRQSQPVRSLIVTSARSEEGKTTTAWYLAAAAASAGLSVVLIESDLRRPRLASWFELWPFPGLAQAIPGDVSVATAVQRVPLSEEAEANGNAGTFDVLVAGSPPPDPAALTQAHEMGALLDACKRSYDLVVVDTPPIAQVADAISLLRHVDGVLVVASVSSTSGPEARRVRDQLEMLDARVIGVVANGGSPPDGGSYAYVSNQAPAVPHQPQPAPHSAQRPPGP